jgi:hypothetical protein
MASIKEFIQKYKPVAPRQPRVFSLSEDAQQQIRRLDDTYHRTPKRYDAEAHFLLWSAIAELVPEVRKGTWKIDHPDALTTTITEEL